MPEGADPDIWNEIYETIVPSVLARTVVDPTHGAKYFANIIDTKLERTRYGDTLAYRVQQAYPTEDLTRNAALTEAGFGLIPRAPTSRYVFVYNGFDSIPVPHYRVPDSVYHAPLTVTSD